jgi:hypothetical protein
MPHDIHSVLTRTECGNGAVSGSISAEGAGREWGS